MEGNSKQSRKQKAREMDSYIWIEQQCWETLKLKKQCSKPNFLKNISLISLSYAAHSFYNLLGLFFPLWCVSLILCRCLGEASDLTGLIPGMDEHIPGRKPKVSTDPRPPMPGNANALLGAGLSGIPRLIWPVTSPYGNHFSIWLGFWDGVIEDRSNSDMTSRRSGSINT